MCLKFAEMERSVGEIDRARAIYTYGKGRLYKNITYFY